MASLLHLKMIVNKFFDQLHSQGIITLALQLARLNLALLYEGWTLRATVQSSAAFSNRPNLDRQAARLHNKIELYASWSSPSLYAAEASENLEALKSWLPFDRANTTASALFKTAVTFSLESSCAACLLEARASSNLAKRKPKFEVYWYGCVMLHSGSTRFYN